MEKKTEVLWGQTEVIRKEGNVQVLELTIAPRQKVTIAAQKRNMAWVICKGEPFVRILLTERMGIACDGNIYDVWDGQTITLQSFDQPVKIIETSYQLEA